MIMVFKIVILLLILSFIHVPEMDYLISAPVVLHCMNEKAENYFLL